VPRSAFLEGAREAGGTKTPCGAPAKQKAAVPPGADLFVLVVLESDGRKREVAIGDAVNWMGTSGRRTARQAAYMLICNGDRGKVRTRTVLGTRLAPLLSSAGFQLALPPIKLTFPQAMLPRRERAARR
jgi:hypothetical protein